MTAISFASSSAKAPVRAFPPQFEAHGDWSNETKPVAFMFGFNRWKWDCVAHYVPDYRPVYCPMKWKLKTVQPHLDNEPNKIIVCWSYKGPEGIEEYAAANNIPIIRMEDGFIRSVGLGAEHAIPYSLIMDKKGLYFDARQASDLEDLLNTYDFSANPGILEEARQSIQLLNELQISKYNLYNNEAPDLEQIYGPKTTKRILVVGQVEQDASIRYGCPRPVNNKILLELAMQENPGADIIFKPHPDVLVGKQPALSDPSVYADRVKIVTAPLSIPDALKTIDHVYTITSLSGFEALIRGIPVTTYGAPFYSGWGLTDDRSPIARRTQKRSIEEVFAASYLLYPSYIDPESGEPLRALDVIKLIHNQLHTALSATSDGSSTGNAMTVTDDHVLGKARSSGAESAKSTGAKASVSHPLGSFTSTAQFVSAATAEGGLPLWFQSLPMGGLKQALERHTPMALALPTAAAPEDSFHRTLEAVAPAFLDGGLQTLDWLNLNDYPNGFAMAQQLAFEQPLLMRRLLLQRLTRLATLVKVAVLPEDISPLGRVMVEACQTLSIPTVILPTQWPTPITQQYYYNGLTGLSVPVADKVLTWNAWQEECLAQRGYPTQRMHRVGTPIVQQWIATKPPIAAHPWRQVYGLNPWQPVWLVIPPQSFTTTDETREAVDKLCRTVVEKAYQQGAQVLFWQPLATMGQHHLTPTDKALPWWQTKPHVVLELGPQPLCCLTSALHHVQGVLSFEWEPLLSAALLHRPVGLLASSPPSSMSATTNDDLRAAETLAQWHVPLLQEPTSLEALMDRVAQDQWQADGPHTSTGQTAQATVAAIEHCMATEQEGHEWSVEATLPWLREVIEGHEVVGQGPTVWQHYHQPQPAWPIHELALPTKRQSTEAKVPGLFTQTASLLSANDWKPAIGEGDHWKTLFGAEAVVQFGNKTTTAQLNQKTLGKPGVFVCGGMIQSGKTPPPAHNQPQLSLMLDDIALYYDAQRVSRIQALLNSEWELGEPELERARALIERCNQQGISQFNHWPSPSLRIGTPGVPKVLLLNQTKDDPTVSLGMAKQAAFSRMLHHALVHCQERGKELIILQPPGSADPYEETCWLTSEDLSITRDMPSVHWVQYDLHPHTMLAQVDEVFTVTSQVGFEAVMQGKTVHCFGVPYYSGRGLTVDDQVAPNRTRPRRVEDVFFAIYTIASRYFLPHQPNTPVALEVLLEDLKEKRV
jgi:capsule polysaccharide export protein KpsC/LpsZ